MRVIGLMAARDEADLIESVIKHVRPFLDELYVWDDDSVDGTWDIVRNLPSVNFSIRRKDVPAAKIEAGPPYVRLSYLNDLVKERFDYHNENVWVVRLDADCYFVNKNPMSLCWEAEELGYTHRRRLCVNLVRHPHEGWDGADTWPQWHTDLRKILRWAQIENGGGALAWKVTDKTKWGSSRLPWPRGLGPGDPVGDSPGTIVVDKNIPIIEHVGKRSPSWFMWRHRTRQCEVPIEESMKRANRAWYNNFRVFPWFGKDSIDDLLWMWNELYPKATKGELLRFYRGLGILYKHIELPPRRDL